MEINIMSDLYYDKSIKVGDIVTSCFSGYWEVTEIEIRLPYANGFLQGTTPFPLFAGKEVLKSNGTIANKGSVRFERWDASHSQKITEEFIREQYNHELTLLDIKKNNLFNLIKNKV
jgi:hypothetical protein